MQRSAGLQSMQSMQSRQSWESLAAPSAAALPVAHVRLPALGTQIPLRWLREPPAMNPRSGSRPQWIEAPAAILRIGDKSVLPDLERRSHSTSGEPLKVDLDHPAGVGLDRRRHGRRAQRTPH